MWCCRLVFASSPVVSMTESQRHGCEVTKAAVNKSRPENTAAADGTNVRSRLHVTHAVVPATMKKVTSTIRYSIRYMVTCTVRPFNYKRYMITWSQKLFAEGDPSSSVGVAEGNQCQARIDKTWLRARFEHSTIMGNMITSTNRPFKYRRGHGFKKTILDHSAIKGTWLLALCEHSTLLRTRLQTVFDHSTVNCYKHHSTIHFRHVHGYTHDSTNQV